MKTAELTGALLDYWVARAENRPMQELRIQDGICLIKPAKMGAYIRPFQPSTDWMDGGPLIEKYALSVQPDSHMDIKDMAPGVWYVQDWQQAQDDEETAGHAPLQAICRAVVRAAFGDDVEEVAVC